MNTDEARVILQGWHRGAADDSDPRVAEALAVAASDPALAAWLAEERAVDDAVRRKLKEFPAPAGLRDAILTRAKVARPAFPEWRRERAAWPAWQRIAAVVALLAALSGFWLYRNATGPAPVADFQQAMTAMLDEGLQLDNWGNRYPDLRDWLRREHAVADLPVPAAFSQLPTLGCRVWEWHGQRVVLVCFSAAPGRTVHFFVADRRAFTNPPAAGRATTQIGRWATAMWSVGDRVVFCADPKDLGALEKLLGPAGTSA